jgi:hypothetical protein
MRCSFALVLALGCGRIGFSDRLDVDADASATDASSKLGVCGWSAAAPDPLTFAGLTIDYPQFTMYETIPDITVIARDAATGVELGSAVSGSDGTYAISIAGGSARELELELSGSGPDGVYFTTYQRTGYPVDGNVTGFLSPLWNGGAMAEVYGAGGGSEAYGSGSLNVQVEHCDGSPIGGATVAMSPAPQLLEYLGSDARPSQMTTATEAMYGAAVGFNMPGGPANVTAVAQGLSFDALDVDVIAGMNVNVLVLYGN